jgi:cytochrome c
MPYTAPGSLSADQIYALTAYLLFINGLVEEGQSLDAENLPQVTMPNAGNFVWAVPGN